MNRSEVKPGIFISASAVGIYGDRGEEKITETTPPADEFLAGVCKAWESEASRAATSGIRVAIPRLGIVLEKEGGMLSKMLLAFRFFAGGPLGRGDQYILWTHVGHLCRAIPHPLNVLHFS